MDYKTFLTDYNKKYRDIFIKISDTYWMYALTGKDEYGNQLAQNEKELMLMLSNKEDFENVKKWNNSNISDEIEKRQILIAYLEYAAQQDKEERIKKVVNLTRDITGIFVNFRAEINGKKVNNNQITDILKRETNNEIRKNAWESSKKIGPMVEPLLKELVEIRNESARDAGFKDYYYRQLELKETPYDELYSILNSIKKHTDSVYSEIKDELDGILSNRYSINKQDVAPWHYEDPFAQKSPILPELELDSFYKNKDIEDLTRKTFAGLGMDVDKLMAKSDLYPRDNKDQHAFCISMDKDGDVRVLCNIDKSSNWMDTMLHEFGHAAYDFYIDKSLPFGLKDPAHIFTTEAIAMVMGRLAHDSRWLHGIAGMPLDEANRIDRLLKKQMQWDMIIFARWVLVMSHFERDMYANPKQDLNKLWWDYVEEFQFIKKPQGRNMPDWATKNHIATAPVYYHNYLLGEILASQLTYYIKDKIGGNHLINNAKAGKFLIDKIFNVGVKYHWNEMISKATGEKLNPKYFIEQFVNQK